MEKMNGKSPDLTEKNIEKLKELFPEAMSDGKIDFEKLKTILGEEIEYERERYNFTWNGKTRSIKLAQSPSTATLRPSYEDSKDWDSTENLYIEGDNLEVLKQLQKTYFNKVKMIYIDPPYNTGGDFVYKDDFKDSIKNYKEQTQQSSRSNADTSGRYHTDWLNMMYPRLMLAKNLLSDDGAIFISIDDNEVHNLRKICDEIYGEKNHVGTFIKKSKVGGGSDTKHIVDEHEYVLIYSRFINNLDEMYVPHDPKYIKRYSEEDKYGRFFWDTFARPGLELKKGESLRYNIEAPDGTILNNRWIRSKERFNKDLEEGKVRIVRSNNETGWSVQFKQYLNSYGKKPRSMTTDFGGTIEGKNDLRNLFGNDKLFSYPKSLKFITKLMLLLTDKNDFILDFFSGSATTAHATMKNNAKDGFNRKFIMVQLPEKTQNNSEAYNSGYYNLCEIGKERIRRAGEQIKKQMEEEGKDSSSLDIGFKVFKLDETNIREWDSSQEVTNETLFSQEEIIKENRNEDDVLYEILLKYGVFDKPVKAIEINKKKAFDIADGYMIVFISESITKDDVKEIGHLKPNVVIFNDRNFDNDNVKINAVKTLEKMGVEDVKSI